MSHLSDSKQAILDKLVICPSCQSSVIREIGRYICPTCSQAYPIRKGIPRFLDQPLTEGERQVKSSFNLEHSRYLDSSYLHFTPRLVEQWLDDIQLPPEYFKDKLVLDCGCGSGRWTYAMASLGATVVAIDLTDAGVEITHQGTENFGNVVALQASVFHLPFRPESFDLVVSWGVLHHTPNTKAAFDRTVPLVRKGGQLYVMVYEKHNPLKYACTDLVRWLLRKLPEDRRYRACKAFVIKNPRLYSLVAQFLICAPHPQPDDPLAVSTLQLGLYDAYAPVFNHLHTREEVAGWFREHQFEAITLTRPVRFKKKKEIRRFGECGGSVNMRGVRT